MSDDETAKSFAPGNVTYDRDKSPINVTSIAPKTDAVKAAEYRAKLRPLLEQVAEIVTAARRDDGLMIGFNMAPDAYGRTQIGNIDVTKPL